MITLQYSLIILLELNSERKQIEDIEKKSFQII